jgi:hypothetical protein
MVLLWQGMMILPVCRAEFEPDPKAVQRYGKGYRYPQAGWIVLHIEGDPYERGLQHGRLLAPEIAAHIRCFAAIQSPTKPADGWKQTRTLCNALFVRRYHKEYLEEMQGIADGASAAGARFEGRPIDLVDIVALNAWAEIDTLDSALEATPTGLEGLRFPQQPAKPKAAPKPFRCSAFAANGKATADGKIVFGHITMFGLYPSGFYNIWLDVQSTDGHRVLMQSYPGGIQSGMDYYLNDAGLLVAETTIAQTRFEAKGMTVGSRIRKALQYADSIDKAVAILQEENNGLYTNEWLLADVKTNEIAMFELGTHKSKLWRSSRNQWYGGTEGFYWGCNNTKDLEVRLETVASVEGRPHNPVFRPSDRDQTWLKLYDKYKGKIDVEFGKLAFTTPPLAAFHSVDAKFITSDMARQLKTWALFGPPLGRTWHPSFDERTKYPEIQPLVGNPWTILHPREPALVKGEAPRVMDLPDVRTGKTPLEDLSTPDKDPVTKPAWHGTILPATDADVWLATGFANYEKCVALEKALRVRSEGQLTRADRDRLAVELFQHRADYELGARAREEAPLVETRRQLREDYWYRVAAGKGVLLLAHLRIKLGDEAFDAAMDAFGREHAGKPVTTAQFIAAAEKRADKKLADFFDPWLHKTGLPTGRSGSFSVLSYLAELDETIIVYGTADEANTNREAAEAIQQGIRARHSNFTVPIRSDKEVTRDELKTHHLILVGRPDCNRITAECRGGVPVTFASQSFVVRGESYAHARSGVIAAGANPLNERYSVVLIAGLGAASTLKAAVQMERTQSPAEVIVLPNGGEAQGLVVSVKGQQAE